MAVRSVCILLLLPLASASVTPYKIGQTFLVNAIDPLDGSAGWALVSHGIAEKLYTVNSKGEIVPQIAQSNSKVDTLNWEVTLKNDYKFSDGTLVTSTLVADALNLLNTKNSKNAQASVGKIVATAAGTNMVKIQTERATPVIESVLAEWVFTVFLPKNGGYLFTGPYAVETFSKSDKVDLSPNQFYSNAERRPRVTIKKYADGSALATALEASEIDMAFHLPGDKIKTLRENSNITIKSFPVEYMYMMWHNMRRSPLSDQKVRKAVDIALDRNSMTQELLGGSATRSFFAPVSPYHVKDSELGSLNADKSGAETLLDQAGWAKNGSGIRIKSGVALNLTIVAYPQRPGLVKVQPLIAQKLEALGIVVNQVVTSGANWDELDNIMAAKDYDLLCWAQNTLPAGDPQAFTNWFRAGAGNNHAGLNSTNVDNLLDKLANAASGNPRITASANAQKAILEQVPISMWMAPAWHVGLSNRMAKYEPWGSDYYIIHEFLFLPATSTITTTITTMPPTTTITAEKTTAVTGSLKISSTKLSKTQVESGTKKALSEHMDVKESAITVTATQSRRLNSLQVERRLAGKWSVAFTVNVPQSQAAAVTTKANQVATDATTFNAAMKKSLMDLGVSEADASVSVTGFTAAVATTTPKKTTAPGGTTTPSMETSSAPKCHLTSLVFFVVALATRR